MIADLECSPQGDSKVTPEEGCPRDGTLMMGRCLARREEIYAPLCLLPRYYMAFTFATDPQVNPFVSLSFTFSAHTECESMLQPSFPKLAAARRRRWRWDGTEDAYKRTPDYLVFVFHSRFSETGNAYLFLLHYDVMLLFCDFASVRIISDYLNENSFGMAVHNCQ